MRISLYLISLLFIAVASPALSQILVEDPVENQESIEDRKRAVGKSAASDYFKKREKTKEKRSVLRSPAASDRMMMLHAGAFVNDKAHRWGSKSSEDDVGNAQIGVTYRVGEWTNSMDLLFRAEVQTFEIDNDKPLKLSLQPIISFPDSRSDFPLYFGAGLGLGIFFEQAENESDLSVDYSFIAGARFPQLFESGGLFFETGIKGHIHLLSSGQQDGVFLSVGGVFNF